MGLWTGKIPYRKRIQENTPKCPRCGTPMIRSEYESPDGDTRYYSYCPKCEAENTKRASEQMQENKRAMEEVVKFYNQNRDLIENFEKLPKKKQFEIADVKSKPKMPWIEERNAFSMEELKILNKVESFFRKLNEMRESDGFMEYKAKEEAELIKRQGKVLLLGNPWEDKNDEEVPLNYESLKSYYWQLVAFRGKKYAIAFLKAMNTPEARKLLGEIL